MLGQSCENYRSVPSRSQLKVKDQEIRLRKMGRAGPSGQPEIDVRAGPFLAQWIRPSWNSKPEAISGWV